MKRTYYWHELNDEALRLARQWGIALQHLKWAQDRGHEYAHLRRQVDDLWAAFEKAAT